MGSKGVQFEMVYPEKASLRKWLLSKDLKEVRELVTWKEDSRKRNGHRQSS